MLTLFSRSRITLGSYAFPILGDLPFVQDSSLFHWPFSISLSQALVHWHIIGKTGSGKSYFLATLFIKLMKAGFGVTLVDPHGTLAPLIFSLLVADGFFEQHDAFDKLLYLDLSEAERAGMWLPFDPFKQQDRFGAPLKPETIAAHFKDAMHRAFPELAQGAAMFDTLLPRSIRVLLHHDLPLIFLEPFLLHDDFRLRLLSDFPDPVVRMFFTKAFAELRKGDQLAYAGSVLRRAQLLTDSPALKYSLGAGDNRLQFRRIMDSGQSVIINASVEDREAMRLLVCLMTVGFEKAALSRGDMRSDEAMIPHFLMIDEFANFVSQSEDAFAALLSETRKFKLHSIYAHQYWSQASERLRGGMGQCENRIAFRLGRDDAEESARVMGQVTPLSIRHSVSPWDSQAAGMAEEWEELVQEFQEQRPRTFTMTLPDYGFIRKLFHLPTNRVVQLRSPSVHKPRLDAAHVAELQQEYRRRYFWEPREPTSGEPRAGDLRHLLPSLQPHRQLRRSG